MTKNQVALLVRESARLTLHYPPIAMSQSCSAMLLYALVASPVNSNVTAYLDLEVTKAQKAHREIRDVETTHVVVCRRLICRIR